MLLASELKSSTPEKFLCFTETHRELQGNPNACCHHRTERQIQVSRWESEQLSWSHFVSKAAKSNYKQKCRQEARGYKNLVLILQLVRIFVYQRDKPRGKWKSWVGVRTAIVRDLIQFNLTLVIKVIISGCWKRVKRWRKNAMKGVTVHEEMFSQTKGHSWDHLLMKNTCPFATTKSGPHLEGQFTATKEELQDFIGDFSKQTFQSSFTK